MACTTAISGPLPHPDNINYELNTTDIARRYCWGCLDSDQGENLFKRDVLFKFTLEIDGLKQNRLFRNKGATADFFILFVRMDKVASTTRFSSIILLLNRQRLKGDIHSLSL